MKKYILFYLLLVPGVFSLKAQENLRFGEVKEIVSPEIHKDNSVTFRLLAPHAQSVEVQGDFLPPKGWAQGSAKMAKDANGVWSYTTKPLPSELYTYSFLVDSLQMNDPNNVYYRRDVASTLNTLLVGGGQAD
ncbi:MAG: esterase, partial [Petrimonas sp.]|nr:esterase [Petrimonas sp.]